MEIKPFHQEFQEGVIDLIIPIQTLEFGVNITKEQQPDLMDIENFYQTGDGNFWCAIEEDKIVGTIALLDIGNKQLALRKMFVDKNHRGTGLAKEILAVAFLWAKERECEKIFLGTTDKFIAAHRFYEKHGFISIKPNELPKSFPIINVDSKFYMKNV